MNIKNRVIAMLLTLCIVIGFLPSNISFAADTYDNWTEVANSAQEGTDYVVNGTTTIIKTAKGLAWFANQVNTNTNFSGRKVELANDINLDCGLVKDYDCSKDDFNTKITETNSWIPIGIKKSYASSEYFEGEFDGKGHTVSGVKINKRTKTYVSDCIGLFGDLSDSGGIRNLGVVDSHIVGNDKVGSLAGSLYRSSIINCYSDGMVEGNSNVGGLAGVNEESSIQNCYYIGTVTSLSSNGYDLSLVGSLVGCNYNRIVACYTLNTSYPKAIGTATSDSKSDISIMTEADMKKKTEEESALVDRLNSWVRNSSTGAKLWENGKDGYPVMDYKLLGVRFYSDAIGLVKSSFVSIGETVTLPAPPTRKLYRFDGWFTQYGSYSGDWGSEFTATIPVYDDMLLYAKWTKVIETLKAEDFTFTSPSNLTYSGTQKVATVKAKSGISCATPTVKYYDVSGNLLGSAPVNAGTYTVKIDVAANENYYAATDLTDDSWTFTIRTKDLTVSVDDVVVNKGQDIPELTVKVAGFVNGESANTLTDFTKPTASISGTVNTLDTTMNKFNVIYIGGNATANYTFKPTVTVGLTIRTVDIIDNDYSTNGKDISLWQKENIILSPVGDYTKISGDGEDWKDSLTLLTEGESSQIFYLKKDDGTVTESKTIDYKLDKTPPTDIKIQYNKNGFTSFLNTITFGLFFKEKVEVTAQATDTVSGIASYQYYAADTAISDVQAITDWQNSLSLTENSKKIVYIKVTDNAGNEVITNNEGVVVYSDSTVTSSSSTFDKNIVKQADITVTMITNDNTLREIKNGDITLTSGTDYIVSGDTVIISKKYLNTLEKDSNQTLTFVFNLLGVENSLTTSTDSVNISIIDSHDHEWDEGKVTTPATAAKEGVITYTCKNCGETKTESIAKLAPTIIEGANSKYTKGGKDGITFRSDAALEDLISVFVDGRELSKDRYTAESGSTVITLKPEYLETLSTGKHIISINSKSGTASVEFTIEVKAVDSEEPGDIEPAKPGDIEPEKPGDIEPAKPGDTDSPKTGDTDSPKTGDTSNVLLWITLLFISGGVLTTFGVIKMCRKQSERES